MPTAPLISVITATYNMGQYLNDAIDSVLSQDYQSLECIVVDDGSDDNTKNILAQYQEDPRVMVICQDNSGQTVAKNRGISAAHGEFLAFCDADNIWLPDKLSRQIKCYNSNPEVGVVYGDIELMNEQGDPLPTPSIKRYSGRITGKLLADNFVTFNTTLVPRRIIDKVGGFDESLSMAIDYDLWLRISVEYEFIHIPAPLARYRVWSGQLSHRTAERFDNCFKLLNQFLDRYPRSVTATEVRKAWAHTFVSRGLWHANEGRKLSAWQDCGRAFIRNPHDMRLWKTIARLVTGR